MAQWLAICDRPRTDHVVLKGESIEQLRRRIKELEKALHKSNEDQSRSHELADLEDGEDWLPHDADPLQEAVHVKR